MPPSLGEAIQSYQNGGATQGLNADFSRLMPGVTTVSGPSQGVAFNPNSYKAASGRQGVLASFGSFVKGVGAEGAHLLKDGAEWVGHIVEDMASAPVHFAEGTYNFGMDAYHTFSQSRQQDELTQRLQSLNKQWKGGSINSQQYKKSLQEWQKDSSNLSNQIQDNQKAITHDSNMVYQGTIGTASDIITVMTAGLSAPITVAGADEAAAFLSSSVADAALSPGEEAITKLAASKVVYDALPTTVRAAVSRSVFETTSNAAPSMLSKQMARTAATNILLKYPLAYSMLSSTGNQVYQELQKDKYGDAVKTMAFNASLLLSGGPIGQAMRYGGGALKGISSRIFGSTSFLDELSKRLGNMNPAGLFDTIKDNPDAIRAFSALEATNMGASDGKPISAAVRVLNGLTNAGWGDASNMSHEDFVKQVMNWHEAQSIVDGYAKSKGLSSLAVGRWTVHDANRVAAALTEGDVTTPQSIEDRLQAWENFKAQNANAAFANNENLDKQIKYLVKNNDEPATLEEKIRGIEAQFGVDGVPKALGKQLAKKGYVVIKPVNLEAPFKEGGRIGSQFAQNSDFFTKTVQPLPVLGSVGSALTSMGLSPQAAGQRVYEVFNTNFAERLKDTSLIYKNMLGEDTESQADLISKKLANYVHGSENFGLKHPPVTDYRQLTTGEIQKALGVTEQQAKEVSDSIMQAMLDVPVSIKGAGNKIMDLNYRINPAAKYYARYQGAFRYGWNPIFKMKLGIKGEILSQLESGGQIPTLSGMNKVLRFLAPDQYDRLPQIEQKLTEKGMLGSGYANEAAEESAAGYGAMSQRGDVHLVASQRRAVSALVGSMADKMGMEPEDFINNNPSDVKNVIQTVLHYNPRNDFLNSPLAHTLNIAFFPFRFNLKVTSAVARALSKQDAVTQFAVIKGFMGASQFLQSPQGMAWYSQNSDIIGLFKYFSPVETLSTIAEALGKRPHSVSQYGELGGLPFGWIPQMLAAQGLIDTNPAYVNPHTGVIAKDYVPVSVRGRLQGAIEDLLGQLFTYPGSTLGLPSKSALGAHIAEGLTMGKSSDMVQVAPTNLTPQQQQFQQAVQQLNGTIQQARGGSQAPEQAGTTTGPEQPIPAVRPIYKSGSSKTPKKKKGQYTPEMLPGQTSLGQIPGA